MESLSDTNWDVVISGTGLQNSLLALALSRSDKKVLHVDQNEYYGDAEAAFSLQEVEEWTEKNKQDSTTTSFSNSTVWKATSEEDDSAKLSFSRAYTLTLSPQIIYTKSKLLSQLVSSKVYRQLEFQAVGNWWIYDDETLRRLPNGREDIFQDKSIDNKSKRGLMKFLKFVIDHDNQHDTWQQHADEGLGPYLAQQYQLPESLQKVLTALTLSLRSSEQTPVKWALPRISRHLTSIGVFGPGFGSVIPKWGGGSEIAQVACRAGAVGGGVYILGTGVQSHTDSGTVATGQLEVTLSNGDVVKTARLIGHGSQAQEAATVSKLVVIVANPLSTLFESTVEGSPPSAVSVVTFPPGSIAHRDIVQEHPIYIMAHSNETGECPAGQSVLYFTRLHSEHSRALLETALTTFLASNADASIKVLYKWYYEQQASGQAETSLDLAFADDMLDVVEKQWREVVGDSEEAGEFMKFEERNDMGEENDAGEEY